MWFHLHVEYKTQQQTNKLIDTENSMVVTRGGVGEDEEGNGDQIYGDGSRLLDYECWAHHEDDIL